jgi:two-component system, cell cycle sensor histidine kinase and response regulator CckA
MRPPPPASKGRLLFMDDEPDIRRVGELVLRHLGYQTVTVANGEDAITAFTAARDANQPFDAVVLDLTIPGGIGGAETLQRLREIDPAVKGIVCSGYCNDDVVNDYQTHGFVAIVAKPYEIAAMGRAITAALEA